MMLRLVVQVMGDGISVVLIGFVGMYPIDKVSSRVYDDVSGV